MTVSSTAASWAARLGARRVAAGARLGIAASGLVLLLREPHLHPHPAAGVAGLALVLASAVSQLVTRRALVMRTEELAAALGGVLVNGLGGERVTVITLMWLATVITGTLARGRLDPVVSAIFAVAMTLPIVLAGGMSESYLGLWVAAVALVLAGRAVLGELHAAMAAVRHEADHDSLTGALSRGAFRSALDALVAERAGPVALAILDIDRFRLVNKRRGHAAGDVLLRRVVREIGELAAEPLVGRIGGDEFAVVLEGDAEPFARRLLERLACDDEDTPAVSGAVGIARAPHDGLDASALLRAADIALRVAKHSPRQRVSTYEGESLAGDGESAAEASLERLIAGEAIELVVQPIQDLRHGGVHAYEALARFHVGSTISPLHWFALADEFNRRPELERACLTHALELIDRLPDGALLCVNVSGPVLSEPETLEILQRSPGLRRLVLEITEDSLAGSDNGAFNAAAALLRRRGVRFAVDDVGAGYAGLRQITAVHPDYLKLDRSLVTGIEADADRAALVAAVADYADRVGALLVAEGVEEMADLEMLAGLGVHLVQGFLLARPAPPWPEAVLPAPDAADRSRPRAA